jgi:spoIIIJ-associated protein
MTFREFTGKNVEAAIRAAMSEFGAGLAELDIEILSQGSRGMLGVGGEEARILAAPKSAVAAAETIRAEPGADVPSEAPVSTPEPDWTAAEPDGAPPSDDLAPSDAPAAFIPSDDPTDADDQVEELSRAAARRSRGGRGRGGRGRDRDRDHAIRERAPREPRPDRPVREPSPFVSGKPLEDLSAEERETLETAQTVLNEMIGLMGITATVEIAAAGETSRLNIRGDDLGVLIGRRGEKLASLQHVVNLIVGRKAGQHHRIAIDVENYRGRREEQLRDVADRAAKRVIQTGKIIQLEAMPAIERRVVHMALLENGRVRTQSVGVEPNRRIVVLPASQVKE